MAESSSTQECGAVLVFVLFFWPLVCRGSEVAAKTTVTGDDQDDRHVLTLTVHTVQDAAVPALD